MKKINQIEVHAFVVRAKADTFTSKAGKSYDTVVVDLKISVPEWDSENRKSVMVDTAYQHRFFVKDNNAQAELVDELTAGRLIQLSGYVGVREYNGNLFGQVNLRKHAFISPKGVKEDSLDEFDRVLDGTTSF